MGSLGGGGGRPDEAALVVKDRTRLLKNLEGLGRFLPLENRHPPAKSHTGNVPEELQTQGSRS